MPERVVCTPSASALIARLKNAYGPLIFHQAGVSAKESAPLCFTRRDFRVGAQDVLVGVVDGCPLYAVPRQFEASAHAQLIMDVARIAENSFSLEAAEGVRFVTRTRPFSEAELEELRAAGPPPRGPHAFPDFMAALARANPAGRDAAA
ncbi:MAG TPA: DUF779 domain-containing protein [Gemmatimonadaceae bacterium]|nr:DUF779 domain-containing protein [Gemmatimonadaceae bacterium]